MRFRKKNTKTKHPVDGSEIRRSPVEVGKISHDLPGFSTILSVVVGFGITINSTASKSVRGPTAKGEHGSRSFASGESIGTGAKNESHLPPKKT